MTLDIGLSIRSLPNLNLNNVLNLRCVKQYALIAVAVISSLYKYGTVLSVNIIL